MFKHTGRLWLILALCAVLSLCACSGGDDDDDDGDPADGDNPGDGDDSGDGGDEQVPDDPGIHDYIIVAANPDLESAAMELKALRHDEGLSVKSTNLEQLGIKGDAEQMMVALRDYLLGEYDPSRTQYVLLIGSHALLPMCTAYLDPLNHSAQGEYTTLTDFYYSDLTSAWDSDGDGFYGEYGDDAMDFNAELLVGRIPLDDPQQVAAVAARIVDWTGSNAAYKNDVMLAAGRIQLEGDSSIIMEVIRTQTLAPAGFNVTRAYADDNLAVPEIPLESSAFIDYWNGHDLGFVMWACHGSAFAAYTGYDNERFFRVADLPDVGGSAPSVVFSSACSNAKATEYSLGHALLADKAAGFIGSTTVTHPGDLGEGSLTFIITIEEFIVDGLPLGTSFRDGINNYMDNFFLKMGYEPQLYLRNIFGFTIYGDPALTYRP
ncbi:MAG: C25 family cysteine peptidase [Candidatus Alcyoniella australis]|nr:C25 family cysteine peptidase [Candidatus Alcyoniella australis]